MKVVIVTFGGSKGQWVVTKSDFLWGFGFPVVSKRIAMKVFSSVRVVLDLIILITCF